MTISATVTALQAIHAGITGVKSAPTSLPQSIVTSSLPMAFTWPGPTIALVNTHGWTAAPGWYMQHRIYIVRCYVKPIAQGSGFDDGYQTAITLLQRFGEAYMATGNQNLGGLIAHLGPGISDGGVRGDMQWVTGGDVFYTGFEFRIEAVEKESL